jgi:dTDP-glucose pyrophosphorylase
MNLGMAWVDTSMHESLTEASSYVETIENVREVKIKWPEGIVFSQRHIKEGQMRRYPESLL